MEERNRPTRTGQSRGQPKGHHASTPKYLLKRFANADNRLTVVRLRPDPEVLRRQHPRRVGTHPELNAWRHEDGSSHDRLETEPLNRIDNAGAEAIRRIAQFAVDARTDEHLRILDWPPDERVGLYLAIAGMMVRSKKLRTKLDRDALPTLLAEMRSRLATGVQVSVADPEIIDVVRATLDRPGAVTLDLARNRHQAALIPLIKSVATTLGPNFLAAVRRLPEPALHTGSEPVVVYPTHRFDEGRSCTWLLAEGEQPVRVWDEHTAMLRAAEQSIAGIAGLALAIDPQTVVFLFDPDTEEGCALLLTASTISPGGLAGMINIGVAAGSDWIAGRDDCEFLRMTAQAIELAN